ncbi:hypothetical protein LTS08_001775 [Lithohypha guttulata]|nr:hypothetical protein LTS08_001775 [Lithohypha guttulata]
MILRQLVVRHDHQAIRSVPGHPDEPSSLLDAVGHKSTPNTAGIEESVGEAAEKLNSLHGQVLSMQAAQHDGAIPVDKSPQYLGQDALPPAPYPSLAAMNSALAAQEEATAHGTEMLDVYHPSTIIEDPPMPSTVTLEMLLANQCHLGHATQLWHPGNSSYIFGIRNGIHIISLEITLSYLRRAARVVQEVARRGGIILFVGTKKNTKDVVVTSALRAEAYHIFSRWIPGSLTNGQQILDRANIKVVNGQDEELSQYAEALENENRSVLRPDLVIVLNPVENEVCLHECGIYNIPTIGIVDTNVNPAWVTYPIPGNDDSPRSVALISGVLSKAAQEGQRLRKEAAQQGKLTYPAQRAKDFLQQLSLIAGIKDVQGGRQGGRSRGEKDKDD